MVLPMREGNFTYVHVAEVPDAVPLNPKIATWNIMGLAGQFSYSYGKAVHWKDRLEGIVRKILAEDADIVILQEIFDQVLYDALISKLGKKYPHIYTHLGGEVWGIRSGEMVLTKFKVADFSFTRFKNNWKFHRGWAKFTVEKEGRPWCQIVATHLRSGLSTSNQKKRREQFLEIVKDVQSGPQLPTLLIGDLNIDRDSEEGQFLAQYLDHGYQGSEPTWINLSKKPWTKIDALIVDYISIFKKNRNNIQLGQCHMIQGFASDEDRWPLSDHQGLSVILSEIQSSLKL